MMRKGVAIPYIIAILLGVGVIGLVGYWLFVSGGQFGGASASQACSNNLALWCTQWTATGYNTEWITSDDRNSFNTKYPSCAGLITDSSAPTDTTVAAAKNKCSG